MSSPRSIRFEDDALERLANFASRRPGVTSASAAARLVEEGLRMDAHPAVLFRDGAAGRRAVLVGGPDVWEIIKQVRDSRSANPKLKGDALIAFVSELSGVPVSRVGAALDYYTAFPDEVDERIAQDSALEAELLVALQRRDALLGA